MHPMQFQALFSGTLRIDGLVEFFHQFPKYLLFQRAWDTGLLLLVPLLGGE